MTVCMFPGQGSQAVGMGKDLFERFPEETRTADDVLGYSIAELCLKDPERKLTNTRFTQPAVFVVNALHWRRWKADTGETPTFLMGHSLGEYNALEAAGAIGFEDGVRLVQKRGALMSEAPPGAMAAVIGMPEDAIRETLAANGLDGIDIANLNSDSQIIVSGLIDDIARAETLFSADGVRYVPLNTGGAFHSRYMEEARADFESFIQAFSFGNLDIPVIANVRALPYERDGIAATLAAQITHPVEWVRSMRYALAQGETEFEELGPGEVLTRLAAEIAKSTPAPAAAPEAPAAVADDTGIDAQERVDRWNRQHPPGTRTHVDGYDDALVTRTAAMTLFGHRAAVYMEGYNGYFDLNDVRPA